VTVRAETEWVDLLGSQEPTAQRVSPALRWSCDSKRARSANSWLS